MKGIRLFALFLAAAAWAVPAPDPEAKRKLAEAMALYHALDLPAAAKHFDQAIDAVPGWKTASGFRAACRWTMGDAAGAKQDAELAAQLKPNDSWSYAARGKARLILKDYEGALEDFKVAAEDNDLSDGPLGIGSVLAAQGRLQEALEPLNDAAARMKDSAAVLLTRGSVKSRLRDYRGAAEDFGAVLEISPEFYWARLHRGKARRELKDYKGAEEDFTAFLAANDQHDDARYLRANVRFLAGDLGGAEADLTKVIERNPRRGVAYANRGQARAAMGENDAAAADFKKAMELDPSRREKIQAALDAISGAPSASPSLKKSVVGPVFIEN